MIEKILFALLPLNRIAAALERIARVAEESMMNQGGRSTGLRSFYNGDDPDAGTVMLQTDEDFAEMELLERKHPADLPLDAELEAAPEDGIADE